MSKKGILIALMVGAFVGAFYQLAIKPWVAFHLGESKELVSVDSGAQEEKLPAMTPDKFACPCAAQGVTCTGPRGGVYCVDSEGVKRYKQK